MKHLCGHMVIIKSPGATKFHQYLNPMERWCYENIPEDHLWTSEIIELRTKSGLPWIPVPDEAITRFFFEHKADAMWFKLVWQV